MENKTILIVDDIVANLDILGELLNKYDVIDAMNGKDALEIVKDEQIDLILLDIMMPEMDGYEVCKILKNNIKTKDIPVIFITAKTDEDSIEKGYDVGGIDYVTKPFKSRELLAKVKTQLYLKDLKQREFEHMKLTSMSEMIRNIAHQWRQPLSIISTASSGMQLQKECDILTNEEFEKSCNIINNNAHYLSTVIENFKNFIQGERKETIFNLKETMDHFLHLVDGVIVDKNINIILDIKNDIQIDGYENELIESLINIFNNAKDVLDNVKIKNKYIFISTHTENEKIIIKIKDNGGGIIEDIQHKIFEPYFTTKHQSQGTGLGLSLTYKLIVDSMDGDIQASNIEYQYNDKDCIGAEFMITLPIKNKI